MISFDTPSHRFHLRAVAIIRRGEAVLLHRLSTDAYWTLPGGRVEPGETAAHTVQRELQEELAIDAQVGPCTLVAEHFFSYEGRAYHELGLYFDVSIAPDALRFSAPMLGVEKDKTLIFEWFTRDQLAHMDLRPAALRDHLMPRQSSDTTPAPGHTRHAVFRDDSQGDVHGHDDGPRPIEAHQKR
jgi:8-oxo-dGTP pyrophosphatase MutT (NUDIX family)